VSRSGASEKFALQSDALKRWLSHYPLLKGEIDFDQYVITCVLSRALEEVEAGEATATEVPDFAD